MFTIAEAFVVLAPLIAKLVDAMCSATYDQEAEKQALFDIERAVADARVKKALG